MTLFISLQFLLPTFLTLCLHEQSDSHNFSSHQYADSFPNFYLQQNFLPEPHILCLLGSSISILNLRARSQHFPLQIVITHIPPVLGGGIRTNQFPKLKFESHFWLLLQRYHPNLSPSHKASMYSLKLSFLFLCTPTPLVQDFHHLSSELLLTFLIYFSIPNLAWLVCIKGKY